MLELRKLTIKSTSNSKIIARCPACAEAGGDRKGEHLYINPDGWAYGCVAHPNDPEHKARIAALAGKKDHLEVPVYPVKIGKPEALIDNETLVASLGDYRAPKEGDAA